MMSCFKKPSEKRNSLFHWFLKTCLLMFYVFYVAYFIIFMSHFYVIFSSILNRIVVATDDVIGNLY